MTDTTFARDLARSRNMLTVEDVDLIQELAVAPDIETVVDLGAGSGTTALAVLEANPRARVYTYDIDPDNLAWAERAVSNAGFADRWEGARLDSVDAAWLFWRRGTRVDLVLIDTSHERAQTIAELLAWWHVLRPGTPVWCHDFEGDYPGVREAIDLAIGMGLYGTNKVSGLGWAGYVWGEE